jgi:type II secretory pathway predicted ATPase ExeA
MIPDYYNLAEQPFGVTPDTRYLYLSPTHREALASLLYGVQTGRGFMSIIAKPGMGKTTLLFWLLKRLGQSARTVFLFQTLGGPADLLRSLLHDLGKDAQGLDLAQMHSQLNERLVAETRQGKQVVVVIDEAQNLSDSALELLRMLSNFETPQQKLMQIILAGQPQLAEKLASPNLVQLRQRISIIARLKPFTPEETNLYLDHRLKVAGYDFRTPLFTRRAAAMVVEHSEGIPRNINNICFNALSLGCALKRKPIDAEIIREVMHDLDLGSETGLSMAIGEPKESELKISTAPSNAGVRGRGRVWLARFATGAMLFLLLTWLAGTGQRTPQVLASQTSPAGATDMARSSVPILSASPSAAESQAADTATRNSAPEHPTVETSPSPEAGPSKVIVGAHTTTRSPQFGKPVVKKTSTMMSESDPSELWEEVKNGSTSADIALANLYLDGVLVQQSCPQAQMLLLAAQKKEDKDVGDLLAAYEKRCQ